MSRWAGACRAPGALFAPRAVPRAVYARFTVRTGSSAAGCTAQQQQAVAGRTVPEVQQRVQARAQVQQPTGNPEQLLEPSSSAAGASWGPAAAAVAVAAGLPLLLAEPALALQAHAEPANALSLPTWAVHTSSVIEWATAMGLIWQYGELSGRPEWKGLTWAMLPCFFSAMCACTWHFFYNDTSQLQFLVVLQAALTLLGNCCCWAAAYRIYRAAQQQA